MAKLVTVTLERQSGVPEDRIVNNFAFVGGELASASELSTLAAAVDAFYNTDVGVALTPLAAYINGSVSRAANAHSIKVYDIAGFLDGSPHGSPEHEQAMTLEPAGAGNSLPAECAVKLRWEAAGRADALVETADGIDAGTAPDRPRQRLTGGVYIGPLHDGAIQTISFMVRVRSAMRTQLLDSGELLADTIVPTVLGSDMQLGVWSRSNQAIVTLEAISVDDAIDTMRSRGPDRTLVERRTL